LERSELGIGFLIGLIVGLALGLILAKYLSKGQGLFITRDSEGRVTEMLRKELP